MNYLFIVIIAFSCCLLTTNAQQSTDYTYWCVGNCDQDVTTSPTSGVVLMGGGTDVDDAFVEQIRLSDNGDFLVIRATGDDAYNQYIYDLGDSNSVATLLFNNRQASFDSFVLNKISQAEAIFIAGGDQWTYLQYWSGTPVESLLINRTTQNNVPIGGTSAGCAVLGQYVYTAANDTVVSSDALQNPYNFRVTLGHAFLQLPNLVTVITDPHFVTRDRMGRLVTFVARLIQDGWAKSNEVHGVGVDEHTAIIVYADGSAQTFGDGTAYMLSVEDAPEVCQPNTPLTFTNITVQKLDASNGDTFSFTKWRGGVSYTISATRGQLSANPYHN